ncbi:MAG: ThiF family adenylyltransferase [Anaerolineales bacterium]
MYEQFFERNFGVFTSEEQQRVRDARVVIVGCGGIGGLVAVALARSGLEHFVLYEFDTYQPSNMNRQIECFSDTLGVNKGVAVKDALVKINPEVEITLYQRALEPGEIREAIQQGDVIVPAADEWALSVVLLDTAKDMGVPAILAYPVGALARVSTFLPESPYASECLVMPYRFPYAEMKTFMDDPYNRRILQYYRTEGAWTQEWFDGWCESALPHAQLCSPVWITGALAATEIIKVVSGKWQPVVAPRYWHITPTGARIAKFGLGRRLLSRLSRRSWGQALLPTLAKRPWLVKLFTRVIS